LFTNATPKNRVKKKMGGEGPGWWLAQLTVRTIKGFLTKKLKLTLTEYGAKTFPERGNSRI